MSQKFLNPIEVNGQVSAEYLDLSMTTTHSAGVGEMVWNDTDGTVDIGLKGGNVKLQVGQEQLARVVNKTSPLITLLESNYQVVIITGATGQRLSVKLAQGNNDANSAGTLGMVTETIAGNQEGFITTSGVVREINTTGSLQGETWADGDLLFLSPTVAGAVTNIRPVAPNHTVNIGYVEYAHAIHGKIYVKVDNGYELGELHDVDTSESKTTPIDADSLLLQDSADLNVWKKLSWSNTKATLKTYFDTLYQSVLTNPITGTGATSYVPKFTGTTSLGNSQIYDNGTNVGIGTSSPNTKLDVVSSENGNWTTTFSNSASGGHQVYTGYNNGSTRYGVYIANGGNDANSYDLAVGSNKLYVLGNGKVGIGTTNPASALHVYSSSEVSRIESSNTTLYQTFKANGTNVGYIGNGTGVVGGGSATDFGIQAPNNFVFATGGSSERMRITPAGNVGIGTSSPSYKLDVNGESRLGKLITTWSGSPINPSAVMYSESGYNTVFASNGQFSTSYLALMTTGNMSYIGGNVGIGTSSPFRTLDVNGTLRLQSPTIDLGNSTDNQIWVSSNNINFKTNGSEKAIITSGGNVGIGTSSPSQKLDINGKIKSNSSIFVDSIGSDSVGVGANFTISRASDAKQWIMQLNGSAGLDFWNYNGSSFNRRITINESGNFGIGTTSPSGKLQVASATAGDDQIWLQSTTYTGGYSTLGYNANTGEFRIKQNDGGSAGITFYTGASASEKMRITPSGNVGIGTSSPSNKLEVNGNAYFSTGSSYAAFQSTFSINSNYAGYNAGIDSNLGTLDSNYNIIIRASDNGNTYTAALAVQSDGTTSTGTTNRQQLSMEGLIQDETIPFDTIIPIKWIKVYNVDDNTHYFIPAYQ